MEDKDREIIVGKSRFYLGEDDIFYQTIVGDVDEQMAIEIKEATDKFKGRVKGKIKNLIDLNKAGRQSAEARKIGIEAFGDEKLGKIALFGLHPVARIIASFVMGLTKKKDMRFFKTKEEALKWLKE